ncbi:hypothetical protein OG799_14550 [Micromonospora sp. NBC_00898]|uniref:hypothetical protein n=1 Tax=Micromonospora sp. NBC_00898 TaxID=2975981 RepID=UPI00386C42E0|nr:hypothetical protein OG799_14550 [Micromonospora sp. NBC_00898]
MSVRRGALSQADGSVGQCRVDDGLGWRVDQLRWRPEDQIGDSWVQDVGLQQQNVVVGVVVGCLYPADDLDQLVAGDVGDLRPCGSGGLEREVLELRDFQ